VAPVEPTELDTLSGVPEEERGKSGTWARRVFIAVLSLVVLVGSVGLLGGHTATATASADGYRLTLQYPGIERAGIDTLWELKVVHPGGFPGPVTVAVTGSYFDLFETQGFYPTPSSTTRDGTNVYMTFTKPPGDTFVVMFDAYIQPYSVFGKKATVSVMRDGMAVASIHYHTWLVP
jgi:hypothetical protein